MGLQRKQGWLAHMHATCARLRAPPKSLKHEAAAPSALNRLTHTFVLLLEGLGPAAALLVLQRGCSAGAAAQTTLGTQSTP